MGFRKISRGNTIMSHITFLNFNKLATMFQAIVWLVNARVECYVATKMGFCLLYINLRLSSLVNLFSILFSSKASAVNCSTNFTKEHVLREGDRLSLMCRVDFRGNLAPVMRWQHRLSDVSSGVSNETLINRQATYSLIVTIDRTMTGTSFTCTTYFSPLENTTDNYASNVPEYSDQWVSPAIGEVKCK